MATRSIVARPTEGGGFTGRYVHFNGEPRARVWALRFLVLDVYRGDVEAAARVLLDEHPNGWVTLPDTDAGECFCHGDQFGDPIDMGQLTHESTGKGLQFAYVLHPDRIDVHVPSADGTGWTLIHSRTWSD